ncbi:hypothetical protein [Nodosilinea sp. AN01ver1]|uniref:hypothetical protein n=1 Tax=Nodosilinea sp. AN01ver1 TaxID=3423362 RepID=UPI003D31CD01
MLWEDSKKSTGGAMAVFWVVILIGGFWLWARSETLKRQRVKRDKYSFISAPVRTRAQPINLQSQHAATALGIFFLTSTFLSVSTNGYTQLPQFTALGNSGEGTGFGQVDERNLANFPPPDAYQEVGGTASAVTFINGSPDRLTIILTKDTGERVELKMPACKECTPYSRDNSPPYGAVGTPITFQIPPGSYKARGHFFGTHNTKGFQSDWQLAQGWEYRSVIYTLDEVHLY